MQPSEKNRYLILGCGSLGFAIADRLKAHEKEVTVIDIDQNRVSTLKDQDFDAHHGDMSDPDFLSEVINTNNFKAVLILGSDPTANKKALRNIKKKFSGIYTVARAVNSSSREDLEELGADMVLFPSITVAETAIKYLEHLESLSKAKELLNVLKSEEGEKLAIVLHDNPEPDAIASALALQHLAKLNDVEAKILYHGEIEHQENRAFVNLLDIELEEISKYNLYTDFRKIALVDHSIPGENNPLSRDLKLDIVIDHHSVDLKNVFAEFIDVRPDVGATATILTKYLQDLQLQIDKRLATALLYGIRVDTDEFKRNASELDLKAASFLYPLADHEMLGKLETPSMSYSTLDVLGDAIMHRKIKGSYLVSNVGFITDRDALPQAADYLLNLEGITTVLVFGVGEDSIHLSARNKDIRIHIANVLSRAFSDIGSAGGHPTAAGASIPLGVFAGVKDKQILLKLVEEAVLKRFFAAVGVEE
jgi:nanoRNase/pAp phosphatase (c-di-AMP/oligoRNAs hydrolase)